MTVEEENKVIADLQFRCTFLESQVNKLQNENYELRKKIEPEWWEDKKTSELPMYVKTKKGIVWKVKYYTQGKYFYARLFDNVSSIPVKFLVPATESEYENQK